MRQSELFEVQSELTDVWLLLDGDLTGVGAVFTWLESKVNLRTLVRFSKFPLTSWIGRVHEDRLVLTCGASTGELLVGEEG